MRKNSTIYITLSAASLLLNSCGVICNKSPFLAASHGIQIGCVAEPEPLPDLDPVVVSRVAHIVFTMSSEGKENCNAIYDPTIPFRYQNDPLFKQMVRNWGWDKACGKYGCWEISLYKATATLKQLIDPDELQWNDWNASVVANTMLKVYLYRYGTEYDDLWNTFKEWGESDEYADKAMALYYTTYMQHNNG